MENTYKKRIADGLLQRKLAGKGAVLIEGAKWCGKTTTAEQIAGSVKYMTETGMVEQNIQLATLNPKLLLKGGFAVGGYHCLVSQGVEGDFRGGGQ